MNNLTVINVYKFHNYAPEIYCDEFGNFFLEKSNAILEKKYYNGRICIQV